MNREPEDIWLDKAEDLKKSKKFEESIKLIDRARDFKEEKKVLITGIKEVLH